MRKILLVLLVLLFINIPLVAAHPFTEETNPSSAANAPVGITEVYAIYSEPVELEFSSLKVFDSNGDQIDNKDARYYDGENSLIVTTPPLKEGVYTVSSKVLSKVDGHLVPDAFIFAVGDIKLDPSHLENESPSELIFLPEAGARFPGFIGETMVLGAVIASLLIWGTQNKQILQKEISKIQASHHSKFMSITGIGLILVFASNIMMLVVQSMRLETTPFYSLQTTFGMTWILRMTITVILLGIWFVMDKRKILSVKNQIPLFAASLVLIATSSMIGHGAASGEFAAVVLDYIHNFVASVWIGGIIYFGFVLLPVLSTINDDKREKISLLLIPRFSIAFIIGLGIVIISGPTLMWFLESDVGLITESVYGKLVIAKILIAAIMVGFGGFLQFGLQRKAERSLRSGKISVYGKLKKSLKIDAVLGIILLGVVALLTNGTLPAGEIQQIDAQEISYGLRTIEFSENAKFDVEITPFTTGNNVILVKASNFDGSPLHDLKEIKVKISNAEKNIAPIEIPLELVDPEQEQNQYKGELTFGFSGIWQVEIEAQRTESANEVVLLNLMVKPHLKDLRVEIVEYEFPDKTNPLFPLYDGKEAIWISDPSKPRLWKFNLDTEEFESFEFEGVISMFLTLDNKGRIWFTDTPGDQIGFIEPTTNHITTIPLPELQPILNDNIPTFIQADFDGNIWIAITNKDILLKYDPITQTFTENRLKDIESLPFALSIDSDGRIWFTESGKGRIGFIEPKTGKIREFEPAEPLASPESMLFDSDGNLWVAEHTGVAIAKFNPILETFERIPVIDQEALPYGMSFDRYGNIWIAQHTVDSFALYDPDNDEMIEVPIPTESSFVQFTTTDSNDNVWFVEQRGSKLGMIEITELPSTAPVQVEQKTELKYTEIASPLMALGIIATSLFFVRSVKDKRRLNDLINS